MPQFDGLRAYAVGLVFVHHWARWGTLPWGQYGVDLFFVLSGFLITGILLRARESRGSHRFQAMRLFYIRRYLRITPVYYATLALTVLAGGVVVRQTLLWHIFYLSNFLLTLRGGAALGTVSHLWSLAVEEQFYLIWPWLILFMPLRYLKGALITIVVAAPVFRFVAGSFHSAIASALPLAYCDTLGMGSYLAYLSWNAHDKYADAPVPTKLLAGLGATGLAAFVSTKVIGLDSLTFLDDTMMALCLGWVILKASSGFTGIVGYALGNPAIRYLGRISYAMYLFHTFMPAITNKLIPHLPRAAGIAQSMSFKFLLDLLLTIALASFSWYLLEKPVNRFRQHFA